VNRFTMMVDERAQHVIETFAVKPLQEHKDFERRIAQNEKDISGLLENQKLMDRNLTRLLDLAVRRGDIPVQIASPGMRP
jgi:primosomal protein N''